MTAITGTEPPHWHDKNGGHRMLDIRAVDGYPPKFWDAQERAYVEHLTKHEELAKIPRAEDDDSAAIKVLFEAIETAEKTITTMRELIIALRKKEH